jgi:hypothetical protein
MAAKKSGRKARRALQEKRVYVKQDYAGATLITLRQSRRITGLGASSTYRLAADGTLPTLVIGKRRYVHREKLQRWLDSLGGTESAA